MAGGIGELITGGTKGLTDLFGGLMTAAVERKKLELQGELQSAQTAAQGEQQAADMGSEKERKAFEGMMGTYQQAMGGR
jgi:hypothetical protein